MTRLLTEGQPAGETTELEFALGDATDPNVAQVFSATKQPLDNGYTRFTVDYRMPAGLTVIIFNSPKEDKINTRLQEKTTGERETVFFDVSDEILKSLDSCSIRLFDRDGTIDYWINLSMR